MKRDVPVPLPTLIPGGIAAALCRLVRDRDRWKRKALDRAANRSPARKREIEARDLAAERLLFGIALEGLSSHQSRGARSCLWDALQALRPDITATMTGGFEDAHDALQRFFPNEDDLKDEAGSDE